MKKILMLVAIFTLFAINALADIPRPEPPKPKSSKAIDTSMTIRISRDAKEAKLIIPKSQVKQLRAQLEELDGDTDANASLNLNFTRVQTIAGGMFLSLAFVFGGVWFARVRKTGLKANKTLVIGAALCLSGALTTIAFANAGPPPEARSITGKMFTQAVHLYKFGTGKIKLETSDDARNIELIVPDTPDKDKPNGEE
jgi:hypothetical protein